MLTGSSSLREHLPDKDFGSTELEVQTNDGIGKLKIIRENEHSYLLIFFKFSPTQKVWEEFWRSNMIPTPEAVDGIWFLCWTRPNGFLP